MCYNNSILTDVPEDPIIGDTNWFRFPGDSRIVRTHPAFVDRILFCSHECCSLKDQRVVDLMSGAHSELKFIL